MPAQAGRTDRQLSDAVWFATGALPRLLGVLDCNGEEARYRSRKLTSPPPPYRKKS
jgi:hypothetical protein